MKILALDIGGTDVKYGYFSETAEEYGKFSVIDSDGTERLPEKIIEFINGLETEHIGICAPGPFDFKTGTGLMEHKLKSLYHISLKEMIKSAYPWIETTFIHDSTAFVLGAICDNPALEAENFSAVMLGTGLGYAHAIGGKVEVNDSETPKNPLWNNAYKDGIAEDYVSATAIINRAKRFGDAFCNVLDIANAAKGGDYKLQKLFFDVGRDMGDILNIKQKADRFESIAIGGQVSLSWELLKDGFESVCNIPYHVVDNPATCAVKGIKYCVVNGKEKIYISEVGQNEENFDYNCR